MAATYWHKQNPEAPLWPDIQWSRPEHKSQAGKLTIIGGNSHGIAAVSDAYQSAREAGVGQLRLVLPASVKKNVPMAEEAVFVPTNPSGGLSRDGFNELRAAVAWADATLLIGDAGRNSETAGMFEELLTTTEARFVVTRDAVDLLSVNTALLMERRDTCLVVSFAQLQKLLQKVYFPRHILFSQPLMQIVDTLHKATITYPSLIVTYHQEHLIAAYSGEVVTMPFDNPMSIWRGHTATKAAVWWLQQPGKPLETVASSWL